MMFARLPAWQVSDAAAGFLRACAAGCATGGFLRAAGARRLPEAACSTTRDGALSNQRSYGCLAAADAAVSQPVLTQRDVQPQRRWSGTASPQAQPGLEPGPATSGDRRRTVAVGISGGVDSAVAALMLQQAGHDVVGEREFSLGIVSARRLLHWLWRCMSADSYMPPANLGRCFHAQLG